MLELKHVTKTFNKGTVNEKVALDDISLTLEDGDFVTVIGGNGAGKSTMLNMISGVYPVDTGQIVLDGNDITHLSEPKRARYLGRVFQDPMLGTAADMQIEENLALAARRGQRRGLSWNVTREERERLRDSLQALPIPLRRLAPMEEAIVTRGGVTVKEINPATMESRLLPGLHFAGEMIDVDAHTGGYNLQIAWSTGALAGYSAARG